MLNYKSTIGDIYAHPIGRDIVDKLLLQLNKPKSLVDNPLVGGLKLGVIKKLLGGKLGLSFFDAILELLNSEPDAPNAEQVEPAPAWWKEAVFYQIYPKSFAPGGLRGILSKLDYLHDLGIDAIWLSPVYDSPNDDNGYDIRDYQKIQAEFGTMADMDELIAGLHRRGMKLVMDLVLNHTSDEHPWFQSALRDENSPYRDFYIFRKSKGGPPNNWTSLFSGPAWNYYQEQDVWALHLFSKKQMDLNWECPALREEVYKMVRWWLEKGVDGFRLDVINFISKASGLPNGNPTIGQLMGYTGIERYFYGPKLHQHLRELRAKAFDPRSAFSVGETPGPGVQMGRLLTDQYRRELDLTFCFDHLESPGHSRFDVYTYDLPYLKRFYMEHLNADCGHGWNTLFFNNHDNPRMISKIDPSGKNTDILAKMLAVFQFTLRGTPFVFQGDEAGMKNGNFTSIDEFQDVESLNLYAELCKTLPPNEAFKRILAGSRDHGRIPLKWDDIERQVADPESVRHFYRNLIILRRASPALVYGKLKFLYPKDKTLFCYTRAYGDKTFYVEANLSPALRRGKALRDMARHDMAQHDVARHDVSLLLSNYGPTVQGDKPDMLRPYEARVYATSFPLLS